jgi:plastocyanin
MARHRHNRGAAGFTFTFPNPAAIVAAAFVVTASACSAYFPEVGELRADASAANAASGGSSGASGSSTTSSSSSSGSSSSGGVSDGGIEDGGGGDGSSPATDAATPQTWTVVVGPNGDDRYEPKTVTIRAGDTVKWVWLSGGHSLASGNGSPDGLFCAPSDTSCGNVQTLSNGTTYLRTFPAAGTFPYYCTKHKSDGMNGSVVVQ